MATIYEVSKLAGVSLATVSRVMNDSGRVSEKTRKKVLAAMAELDYQPNTIAQSLASNCSNSVGVLVSELHGPIFGAMLSAIESELRGAGKFPLFAAGHSDAEREREGIRFLASRNCDALILHVEALPSEFFVEQKDSLIPFVLINREDAALQDRCISLDNERGGYLATKSLLEFGHRNIGYVSGPLAWADAHDRLEGHKQALGEFGVAFDEQLLVEGDYTEYGGSRSTRQLLESGVSMTAIVCANDEMAAGALHVVRKRDIAVPAELSVVGFDNVGWARYLYPKLSTVDFPVSEMSRAAARWVLKNVYGQNTGDIWHTFQPRFVQRGSSGPAPGSG